MLSVGYERNWKKYVKIGNKLTERKHTEAHLAAILLYFTSYIFLVSKQCLKLLFTKKIFENFYYRQVNVIKDVYHMCC